MSLAPTLSHATPRPPSWFLFYYLVFITATLIPAVLLLFIVAFYIPRISTLFAPFGDDVPLLTHCVLALPHLARNISLLPFWLLLIAAIPVLPAYLCTRHEDPRRRTSSVLLYLTLYVLLFYLALFLTIISMLLPFFQFHPLIR